MKNTAELSSLEYNVKSRRSSRQQCTAKGRFIAVISGLPLLTAHLCFGQFGNRDHLVFEASDVVSVRELMQRIPKPAARAFDKGLKAARKGDYASAAGHFQASVAINPEFFQALNNLGAMYSYLHQSALAIEQFSKATALCPNAAFLHRNLSIAYLRNGDYSDGEHSARQALALEPRSKDAKLLLGASLVLQNRMTGEAETHLREAAGEFPEAYLWLGAAYCDRGDAKAARSSAEAYLRAGQNDRARMDFAADIIRRTGNLALEAHVGTTVPR